MKTEGVSISDITVPAHRARGLDTAAVDRLADSITRLGLQTPVTVRYDSEADDILLVAGLHRLEAARKLGWDTIPAIYTEGTADEARMWEIAENLHRAELSVLERDEHVAEWLKLADVVFVQVEQKPKAGRPEGGISRASREIGVDRQDARRAKIVASLPDQAKEIAREAGLDENRAAMLRAGSEPNPAAQLAAMKREVELAEARKANAEIDKLVKERRVEAIKEWLARRLDVTEMHNLGEMLAGLCDPISKALLREAA
jgi:ParB-like chromosome segregation protein Spo0J